MVDDGEGGIKNDLEDFGLSNRMDGDDVYWDREYRRWSSFEIIFSKWEKFWERELGVVKVDYVFFLVGLMRGW